MLAAQREWLLNEVDYAGMTPLVREHFRLNSSVSSTMSFASLSSPTQMSSSNMDLRSSPSSMSSSLETFSIIGGMGKLGLADGYVDYGLDMEDSGIGRRRQQGGHRDNRVEEYLGGDANSWRNDDVSGAGAKQLLQFVRHDYEFR